MMYYFDETENHIQPTEVNPEAVEVPVHTEPSEPLATVQEEEITEELDALNEPTPPETPAQ